MNNIYVLTTDTEWLKALTAAVGESTTLVAIHGANALPGCVATLPPSQLSALLLIDATGQPDILSVVRSARVLGWTSIVVVAAAQSFRQARTLLKEPGVRDYIAKSYAPNTIRRSLSQLLAPPSQPTDADTP